MLVPPRRACASRALPGGKATRSAALAMIVRAPLAGWIEPGVVFPGVKSVADHGRLPLASRTPEFQLHPQG
jgi:hypothetical protein